MELVGLFISHAKGVIDSTLGEESELENRLVSLNLFKSEAREKTSAANEDDEAAPRASQVERVAGAGDRRGMVRRP